jgi:hypothetical protein
VFFGLPVLQVKFCRIFEGGIVLMIIEGSFLELGFKAGSGSFFSWRYSR